MRHPTSPERRNRSVRRSPALMALMLPLALLVPWGVGPRSAARDVAIPMYAVSRADGPVLLDAIREIKADGTVVLGKPPDFSSDQVISLRRLGPARPAFPSGPHVILVNGDRLTGYVTGLTGERLELHQPRFRNKRPFTIPLSAVALLWFHDPAGLEEPERLRRQVLAQRRTRDVLWLRNGDRIEGTLESIDGATGTVMVSSESGTVRLDRDQVAFIALNSELAQNLRPDKPYWLAVLADGSRVSFASLRSDEGQALVGGDQSLVGQTLTGSAVEVPVSTLLALERYNGRAVFLSDLQPRAYEFRPFNDGGPSWPLVRDGSVGGRELRLGGSVYEKGLGLHSQSRVTYDLNGTYRFFEAVVGLDEQTGRGGCARIQVLVDGQPRDLGFDGTIGHEDTPRPIQVRVAGARELTLVVDFGVRGRFLWDAHNHVNWADARLIR
ncbi:MAG: NPCBM/NEW2 domain-containing protein [Gemmataceae bacterium]|nr:NPCBM/NEW2 domain-containing protein [Gemmataceae bacterium]MDW8265191.1 NPCBM/NEW2 domain-containing protein [Gemmataceae bacterium]